MRYLTYVFQILAYLSLDSASSAASWRAPRARARPGARGGAAPTLPRPCRPWLPLPLLAPLLLSPCQGLTAADTTAPATPAHGTITAPARDAPTPGEQEGEAALAPQHTPGPADPAAREHAPAPRPPMVVPASAAAVDTRVAVRVRSRDGRFVTTDMGARVTLRDADTGERLAQGLTLGNKSGSDAQLTAAFRTTLALREPVLVVATVRAPLTYPHAAVEVSSTQWLLPGRHVDDWSVELPGFAVTVTDSPARVALEEGSVSLTATVMLMCGCPTQPDGEWDADAYELLAHLRRDGQIVASAPLIYAGEPSTFHSELPLAAVGAHEVLVTAFDPATGNAGVTRVPLIVVD